MEHKLLYIVAITYQKPPTESAVFVPKCHLSLQLGYTAEECIEAARKQAVMHELMSAMGSTGLDGWTESVVYANHVSPAEIERLNREAGTTAIMLWPDLLDDEDGEDGE